MLVNEQPYYKYVPLPEEADSFRLLEHEPADDLEAPIRCRLHNSTLAAADGDFAALSYMWGTPGDRVTISLKDDIFYVQRNLCQFLRHVRNFQYETLWVDGICVDQYNLPERSNQVRLMRHLYKSANHVVAYLGDDADDSDLLFRYLNKVSPSGQKSNHQKRQQVYSSVFVDGEGFPLCRALEKLCSRDYWSRLWIVQETVLPEKEKNIYLICGGKRIRMPDLASQHRHREAERAVWRRRHDKRQIPWPKSWEFIYTETYLASNNRYLRLKWRRDASTEKANLLDLVQQCAPNQCSDSRDYVFGLMSLAIDGSGIKADYIRPVICVLLDLFRSEMLTRKSILRLKQYL